MCLPRYVSTCTMITQIVCYSVLCGAVLCVNREYPCDLVASRAVSFVRGTVRGSRRVLVPKRRISRGQTARPATRGHEHLRPAHSERNGQKDGHVRIHHQHTTNTQRAKPRSTTEHQTNNRPRNHNKDRPNPSRATHDSPALAALQPPPTAEAEQPSALTLYLSLLQPGLQFGRPFAALGSSAQDTRILIRVHIRTENPHMVEQQGLESFEGFGPVSGFTGPGCDVVAGGQSKSWQRDTATTPRSP
jgi:hypothetical protein